MPEPSESPAAISAPRLLLQILLAVLTLFLSALLLGACAMALASSASATLALVAAVLAAVVLAGVLPLLLSARLLAMLRRWKPRPAAVTLSTLCAWNLLLPGLLLGLAPDFAGRALQHHGNWIFGHRDVPVISAGLRLAGELLAGEASHLAAGEAGPPSEPPRASQDQGPAAQQAPPLESLTPQELFAQRRDSVVVIRTRASLSEDNPLSQLLRELGADTAEGLGSGFVVSAEGLVVTNQHVLANAQSARVTTYDGRSFDKVQVLCRDPQNDLALLRIPAQDLQVAPLAPDGSGEVGQQAWAIGSPLGLEHSLTEGMISAIRDLQGTSFFQMQTTIAPGSSGGPLFDELGQVIGVNTATRSPGLNLAVQASYVRQLLQAERQPADLQPYLPGVRVASLSVQPEILPTQRLQLEEVMRMLGRKADGCVTTLPADARLALQMTPGRSLLPRGELALTSNLGPEAEACIGQMQGLLSMSLDFLLVQVFGLGEEGVSLEAQLEGLGADEGGAGQLLLVLRLGEEGEAEEVEEAGPGAEETEPGQPPT